MIPLSFLTDRIQEKDSRIIMSEEYDEAQMGEEGGMPGPGAPTPLSALEVNPVETQL